MCGIVGIYSKQSNVTEISLKLMTNTIVHRGPDAEGHWVSESGTIGFGHRRLAIVDLSDGGAQPKSYREDNSLTITFNGEIYNYLELKDELHDEGVAFNTDSDTEVLLALYNRYGKDCLDKLDGMFAFSIWDERKQELFCARDRVGEKPFFYTWDGSQFVFASEIKALKAYQPTIKIDKEKLQNYLVDGQIKSNSQSFFEGVCVLPSASTITIKNGVFHQEKYWEIDLLANTSKIEMSEASTNFKQLFLSAIERRMRMDVDFGTSLSGGLDSSSIASAISSKTEVPLKTFSARFDGPMDEGKWMKKVIDKFELKNEKVYPKFEEMMEKLSLLTYHQEYPLAGSSMFAQWSVMELVKQNNVTVLIDGQGADEFLCGYKEFKYFVIWDLFYKGNFTQFFNERKLFNKYFGENEKLGWRFILYPLMKLIGRKPKEWEFGTNLKERLKYAVENDLSNLLMSADRNAMAHSVEVRLPFTNNELMEFAINLPSEYLYKNGETKKILRESMKGILPDAIVNRKDKIGFAPPQQTWLLSAEGKKITAESVKVLNQYGLKENSTIPWRNIAAASFIKTFS
jgi:asparagine synthase (glutamine-hydrolysing)